MAKINVNIIISNVPENSINIEEKVWNYLREISELGYDVENFLEVCYKERGEASFADFLEVRTFELSQQLAEGNYFGLARHVWGGGSMGSSKSGWSRYFKAS